MTDKSRSAAQVPPPIVSKQAAPAASHTPGPWSENGGNIRGPNGVLVATVHGRMRGNEWRDEFVFAKGFVQGNRRLIAAAPELLALAQQVIDVLYERAGPENEHLSDVELELWYAARAAIAQATGEQT